MTRYGRRPLPTGPLHPRGCHCPRCDRATRAEAEAQRLRDNAAREAAARLEGVRAARERLKIEAAREVMAADERAASLAVRDLREAKARADADPKAARLRELRAAGKTLAEAIEIIESEGS